MNFVKFRERHRKLLPGVPIFLDGLLSAIQGHPVLDIIKLDQWMIANDGYIADGKTSLSDFVISKYGKKANDFIANI